MRSGVFLNSKPFGGKSTSYKLGSKVELRFEIGQHSRDSELLTSFAKLVGCGSIRKRSEDVVVFIVTKFSDIYEKIIPFFQKYPIVGAKALDYADFCKAAELMKTKAHLTASGLEQIRKLKTGMNTGRKMSTWARPQLDSVRKDLGLMGTRRAIHSESLGALLDTFPHPAGVVMSPNHIEGDI